MNDSKSLKYPPVDQEWVQILINLRMKHAKQFTGRRNSATEGWKLIFGELQEVGAPSYLTISKIKKKWMNLMTRYKQIKNNINNLSYITWPYFDQIDRAFGRSFENKIVNDNEEKQSFIKNLIELRHKHKHLFTGKKYTAIEGWTQIKNLINDGNNYTVEQLGKCWQNLVQRYKQLSKEDNRANCWPYFHLMDRWYMDEITIKTETIDDESEQSVKNDNFIQLLEEIKMKQEEQFRQTITILTKIQEKLNCTNN